MGREAATENGDFRACAEIAKKAVSRDEVEWFVQMVEERKTNHDHKKEKKNL